MLNGWGICLGVLWVFFITSTVFAQSQSATDTIIEKIGESERRVRDHVDTKIEGVETKVETLSTQVGTLSTDVAVNKTNIGNMKESIRDLKGTVDRIWYGILGVFGTLILYFLKSWWENRGKADNVDTVDRLAEEIIKLTSAQADISAQITRLISAQAGTSETRNVAGDPKVPSVEGLDELADDDIPFTRRDAGETD
ncbi:MAG: hypothetical protein OXL96_20585 [Candidatus Poribacteria bacterium]|nr:hypothetical protein [Candidatus Poribacteria bacterium]